MQQLKFCVASVLFLFTVSGAMAQSAKDKTREAQKDKETQLYGFQHNTTGRDNNSWAIAPLYEGASRYFSENLAAVQLNGKVGYIDTYNRFVITPRFDANDDLLAFSEGLSAVKVGGKYGFIDKAGTLIIEPQYEWAENFNEKYVAAVKKDGKVGAIDLLGEEVLPFKYLTKEVMVVASLGKTYKNAVDVVKTNKDNGKYDAVLERIRKANMPIEANIRNAAYQSEIPIGVSPCNMHGKWGLKSATDPGLLPAVYDEIYRVDSAYCLIRKGEKWGVCDVYGRVIVPCSFEFVDYIEVDKAFQVKADGFIGMYETDGRVIVEPCFDLIETFRQDSARVWSGSSMGSINRKGKTNRGFSEVVLAEADAMAVKGDVVKARQLYGKVIKLDERCGMAYISLGVLEVEAQQIEEGIEHIKEGGKVLKSLSKTVSHNLKEAKKPMGQRVWLDGRSLSAQIDRTAKGMAQVDVAGIDPKFSEELSAQARAQTTSLANNSAAQKNDKACCDALKARRGELKQLQIGVKSDELQKAIQSELARLEQLLLSKGGIL